MAANLAADKFWFNKNMYHEAEKKYYENQAKGGVGGAKINQNAFPKSSLAGEVAKARQHIKSSLECIENINGMDNVLNARFSAILEKIEDKIENLTRRIEAIERNCGPCLQSAPQIAVCPAKPVAQKTETKKVQEEKASDTGKKPKKPAPVAKSNIILDIKPWDDETNMEELEKAVRSIKMDGLLWGASKLVPVAFKIFKLQISCVVEDDKVSVDLLTEMLEDIQDYIQSVDIAAFNKV